jgi:hypothetical protein
MHGTRASSFLPQNFSDMMKEHQKSSGGHVTRWHVWGQIPSDVTYQLRA